MTADPIQAAKERLEIDVARILACQPAITGMEPGLPKPDRWVRDLGGDLALLLAHAGRLEVALKQAHADLEVIHKAAAHCQGKFGGRMSEVDRIFQEITRVSSMHHGRAALLSKGSEEPAAPVVDDLTWLAGRTNLELDHGAEDEEADAYWRIHSVNGGVNDREWTLVAIGRTPAEAIRNARLALAASEEKGS